MMCRVEGGRGSRGPRGRGISRNEDGSVYVRVEGGEEGEKGMTKRMGGVTKESQLAVNSMEEDEHLVALEYIEERPPVMCNRGMVR
jgi:hypothetical protein